jgi:hypothetical protein
MENRKAELVLSEEFVPVVAGRMWGKDVGG